MSIPAAAEDAAAWRIESQELQEKRTRDACVIEIIKIKEHHLTFIVPCLSFGKEACLSFGVSTITDLGVGPWGSHMNVECSI